VSLTWADARRLSGKRPRAADIEAYRNSEAHKEIVRHARALKGAKAEVKLYDLVQ
jgi:hypothetical protein